MTIDTHAPEIEAVSSRPDSSRAHAISLLELLMLLLRSRWAILRNLSIGAVMVGLVILFLPNSYTATTTVLPPKQQQSLASALAAQLGAGSIMAAGAADTLGLKSTADIYVSMLKSRTLEDAIIQRFDLMKVYRKKRLSDARKKLESRANIKLGKDGLISVAIEDHDPQRAADLANAYVEELRTLNARVAVTEAGQRRLFFQQALDKAKDDLSQAEVAMQQTQLSTGIIHLDGQAQVIIQSVATTRAQIAAAEVRAQQIRAYASEKNPDFVQVQQQISALHRQLADLEKKQNSGNGDLQIPTGKVPEMELQYIRRLREVKRGEAIVELLSKELEAAQLDEARQGTVLQVLDRAMVPDRHSSPRRGSLLAVSLVILFLVVAGWSVAVEVFHQTANDPAVAMQLAAIRAHLSLNKRRWPR